MYIDYRAFIKNGIEPRFPFGYGLTYTSFEYLDLEANFVVTSLPSLPPTSSIVEGGQISLFEILASIQFKVVNTGEFATSEVAQLYVGIPNAPARQLRGFDKRLIEPGASESFHLSLTRRDLSIWDVVQQNWVLQKGRYEVFVGKSVLDIQLQTFLAI